MAAFDAYKGYWMSVFGPNSIAAPTQNKELVVNSDGSINTSTTSGGAKAPTFTSAGAGQMGLSVGAVTAVNLTPPAGALYAQITVSGANIRYRDDGVAPTTTVGMPVFQASAWLYGGPLANIQFIAQSGTATLDVLYYK